MEPQTTNKTMGMKPIFISLAVVVLAGGVWYFSHSQSTTLNTSENKQIETTKTMETQQPEGVTTLADLWKKGGNHICTVTMADPNANAQGVVYIADSSIRADFNASVVELGNKMITTSMIAKDGMVYTWTNMYPQGMKAKMTLNETSSQSTEGAFTPNAKVSYACNSWTVDTSKFELPTAVTFVEMGAQ